MNKPTTPTHGAIPWKGGMLMYRLRQDAASEKQLSLWEELAATVNKMMTENKQLKAEQNMKNPTVGPTCIDIANMLGHDQAKAMGIPLSDEPFPDFEKRIK